MGYSTGSIQKLVDGQTITADGNGTEEVNTKAARVLEIWGTTTNTGGTTSNLDLLLEAQVPDSGWVEVDRIAGFTTNTSKAATLNVATVPLGTSFRVSWEVSGTAPTFDLDAWAVIRE